MQPGAVVSGRFQIEVLAGGGGMGAVYRALDRQTGTRVAVKVLHGKGEGQHVERFAREARLLAELRHPTIVEFVASGPTEGGAGYLAMEWLDGESLSARLARGPLSVSDTLTVGRRVAEALEVAHRRGIVHRDLKPANLFLVQGEIAQTKVLDFGIARVLEAGQALTVTGTMLGTPGYMAPEQANGEKDVDERADVYALGCVLFRCLAGRAAYEGESALTIALRMIREPPPRVLTLRTDVPLALDALIDRMLARARDDRPQSASVVMAELDAIAARLPAGPSGSVAFTPQGAPGRASTPEPPQATLAQTVGWTAAQIVPGRAPATGHTTGAPAPETRQPAAPISSRRDVWIAVCLVFLAIAGMAGLALLRFG